MGCCLNLLLGLVKTVVTVLILINIRSFPLVWHVRILVNELVLERLRALRITSVWLPLWKTKSDARLTQKDVVPQLEASRVFAGQSIFEVQSVRKGRVWPDVVDYNLHLSNSCYASIVDLSRMRFWVRFFVRMGSDGGTAALGGADYTYHAEIPFMAPFQVETFVQAWDEKWLYLVGQFVAPPKAGKPRKVYCTTVSRYCMKHGRRTVPPWFLLATHGFGAQGTKSWRKAEELRAHYQAQAATERKVTLDRLPTKGIWYGSGPKHGSLYQAFFALIDAKANGSVVPTEEDWTRSEAWDLASLETQRLERMTQLNGTQGQFLLPNKSE